MPRPNRIIRPKLPTPAGKPVLYAIPAYGRLYRTKDELKVDWENGKDFKIVNGPYFSVRDLSKIKESYSVLVIECSSHHGFSPGSFVLTL